MEHSWAIAALSALVLTAIACIFAVIACWRLSVRLKTLSPLEDEDEELSGNDRYSLFVQAQSRLRSWLTIALFIWQVFSYFAYTATYGMSTLFLPVWPKDIQASLVAVLLPPMTILIPLACFELLAATGERRALEYFRDIQVSATSVLQQRARFLLWLYPAAFLVLLGYEAYHQFDQTQTHVLDWLAPIIVACYLLLNIALAGPVRRWLYPTRIIGETVWAEHEMRIREWARVAGVDLRANYIQSTEQSGKAPLDITGFRRHSLYLSNLWLCSTDWRQQDAMLCTLLGRAVYRRKGLIIEVVGVLGCAVVYALYGWASTIQAFGFLNDLPLLPPYLPAIPLYFWTKHFFLRADAFAVTLTGDPYALLAALQTWGVLSGKAVNASDLGIGWHFLEERGHGAIYGLYFIWGSYFPATWIPTIAGRSKAIDVYMRTEAPHAPWATMPVPSIAPLFLGGSYPITRPLDAIPPVAPVPYTVYPRTLLFAQHSAEA